MYAIRLGNHLSRSTYNAIRHAYSHKLVLRSEYRLQRLVDDLSHDLVCVPYDCCIQSCCIYVGDFKDLQECPHCGEPPYDGRTPRKPRQTFLYIPVIPRLRGMFSNPELATTLQYRHTYDRVKRKVALIQDVFDCTHYRDLLTQKVVVDGQELEHRYFSEPEDIALGLAGDGIQVFRKVRRGNSTVTPLILINYNLPPTIRTRLENVLALGVIPGPLGPKDTNSFLRPFKEECDELARGVSIFNAATRRPSLLHAYTLFGLGDIPWITKVTCTKGHNAFSPCHTCEIQGVSNPAMPVTIYYVPLAHPHDDWRDGAPTRASWNPNRLPLRTEESFSSRIQEIRSLRTQAEREQAAKEYGLHGESIISTFPGIRMSRSFPWECLHLFFENTIPNMIRHWRGKFGGLNARSENYIIHPDIWEVIGEETAASMKTIPSAFVGHMPNIATDQGLYKGEFYSFWFLYLAPFLLHGRFLNDKYYKHACQLIKIIKSLMDLELRRALVPELRKEMIKWVLDYERWVQPCGFR